MITIAHIINPAKVDQSSDLFKAQPIVFESIRKAKQFAEGAGDINISLYSAQFREDCDLVPDFFTKTADLERSVLDLSTFSEKRKLPLLKDILDRLYASSNAEYFIYTNADIGLLPYFYVAVGKIISGGADAFVINRRTVLGRDPRVEDISLIYAEIGKPHLGHDCFVFPRTLYPEFKLGNVCLGIRLVGRVLLWNLVAHARNFMEFKNLHLTFHLGEEKPWKDPAFLDYDQFNLSEAKKVLGQLDADVDIVRKLREKYPEYLIAVD